MIFSYLKISAHFEKYPLISLSALAKALRIHGKCPLRFPICCANIFFAHYIWAAKRTFPPISGVAGKTCPLYLGTKGKSADPAWKYKEERA